MGRRRRNELHITPHGDSWKLSGYVGGRRIRVQGADRSRLEAIRGGLLRAHALAEARRPVPRVVAMEIPAAAAHGRSWLSRVRLFLAIVGQAWREIARKPANVPRGTLFQMEQSDKAAGPAAPDPTRPPAERRPDELDLR